MRLLACFGFVLGFIGAVTARPAIAGELENEWFATNRVPHLSIILKETAITALRLRPRVYVAGAVADGDQTYPKTGNGSETGQFS